MNIDFKKIFASGWLAVILSSCLLMLLPMQILAQSVQLSSGDQGRCTAFENQFQIKTGPQAGNVATSEPFYCSASQLILVVINYLLAISGTVSVLFLIVGGFWYLTSAGNEEQAEKGKKTLINSLIGLVVIILSFTIVKIVAATISGLGK